ncbi:bifunctional phosphoribosylaminoimidazolecarboxamide formyltransferase/inosine monophosphate cyclohydrolase, partial [bacterium]|nr:bifunctional phosphoribosylaminoimidazolecarboxamide formyltransferase/inosine monophosphate cyclohydrolase [bacterium]
MRVLVSVSDKTGIVDFCRELVALGSEIVSTGGTYQLLNANGVATTPIESVTGFPEMMDGRVKTLHPKIHGGILARRDTPSHLEAAETHGIGLIGMVVVNLYPFEATTQKPGVSLEEVIENIDIGGPSMIRSAAKNYRSVAVVVNPDRYSEIVAELKSSGGSLSDRLKEDLALEAFSHTGRYDTVIASYLTGRLRANAEFPDSTNLSLQKSMDLRYGENPHQKAAFYSMNGQSGVPFIQLHGKELSYNNLIDLEAAWQLALDLKGPGAAIIKHTNPCGVGSGEMLLQAWEKA